MLYLSIFLFIALLWSVINPKLVSDFSKEASLPLRGMLALLIVMHHLSLRLTYMIPEESKVNYLRDFNCWGEYVVSIFFFLSGYGIVKSYQKKGTSYLDGFISGRLLKLMIPFIICSLIYLLFYPPTFSSIISLNTWKNDCPLLPSSWFVVAILLQYLIFYIVALFFRSVNITIVSAWLLSVLLMILLKHLEFKTFWWHSLLAFNVGMSISYHEVFLRKYMLSKKLIFLVFCLLLIIFYLNGFIGSLTKWSFLLNVVLLPFFVWQMICNGIIHNTFFLNFIGKISYEIYLVHVAILCFLFPVIGKYPILFIVLTYALSLMCAYALNYLVRKIVC